MKLNATIEEYDIKNLDALIASVGDILGMCRQLRSGAEALSHNIGMAEQGFQNENMQRAQEIIKKYIARLTDADRELRELITSVNEYAEKLRHAWRAW